MKVTLTGAVKTWKLNGHTRKFAMVTVPYHEARELFCAMTFDAVCNQGEQRELCSAHVRKLKKAMESGEYTPTPASVGLRKEHRKKLTIQPRTDGSEEFTLEVDGAHPLPLTDASHRLAAIGLLLEEFEKNRDKVKTPEKKEEFQKRVEEVLALPITCTVYLDGETRRDFVNLQAGRNVDPSHLFSLKVQQKPCEDSAAAVAFAIAKVLKKQDESPFENQIRFDSRGSLPLPITTLCSQGPSDAATSLLGLAKVGEGRFDTARLAGFVTTTYRALQLQAPELLEYGKVLTPIGNDGTKGSATMLIGLAVCLTHRIGAHSQSCCEEEIVADLVRTAKETLNESVNGGFSGQQKRAWMRGFAAQFFAEDVGPKHAGLPVALLQTLSASAFGVPKLPKAPEPQKDSDATAPQLSEVKTNAAPAKSAPAVGDLVV